MTLSYEKVPDPQWRIYGGRGGYGGIDPPLVSYL